MSMTVLLTLAAQPASGLSAGPAIFYGLGVLVVVIYFLLTNETPKAGKKSQANPDQFLRDVDRTHSIIHTEAREKMIHALRGGK